MRERRHPHSALPFGSLYHATKWGIEGFSESMAQEVAPFGIGVTIVEPGGARTTTIGTLEKRLDGFRKQSEFAATTDFPPDSE
jgi:NAD(P)-dependent dehydrogenase (short-subunit alcohol dehydrogenase family)